MPAGPHCLGDGAGSREVSNPWLSSCAWPSESACRSGSRRQCGAGKRCPTKSPFYPVSVHTVAHGKACHPSSQLRKLAQATQLRRREARSPAQTNSAPPRSGLPMLPLEAQFLCKPFRLTNPSWMHLATSTYTSPLFSLRNQSSHLGFQIRVHFLCASGSRPSVCLFSLFYWLLGGRGAGVDFGVSSYN